VNWKGCKKKWCWCSLRFCPGGICLERLGYKREMSLAKGLNRGPPSPKHCLPHTWPGWIRALYAILTNISTPPRRHNSHDVGARVGFRLGYIIMSQSVYFSILDSGTLPPFLTSYIRPLPRTSLNLNVLLSVIRWTEMSVVLAVFCGGKSSFWNPCQCKIVEFYNST